MQMKQSVNILAIETSCDETAGSVISIQENVLTVRSNVISSQVALHAKWGGVVPNLAAREHTKNIIPVLTQTLKDANMTKDDIDIIAVTQCPGLIPALLSGVSCAKSLSYAWQKPLLGIHHIEGHIYANWIDHSDTIIFPILALVVSGGHTQLILMSEHCQYEIVGETQDDAVGEAFDKVARILGLGYPGGPIISERAQKFADHNIPNDIALPKPMLHSNNYHFSFSGIKTAVLYLVREYRKEHNLTDNALLPSNFIDRVAHAFQTAVVNVLTAKTLRAAEEYNVSTILLAGGVSANTQLRANFALHIKKSLPHVTFSTPQLSYCVDNAAMIGVAAYYRYQHMNENGKQALTTNWKTIHAQAHQSLNSSK